MAVMWGVSVYYSNPRPFQFSENNLLDIHPWKYAKPFSIVLTVVIIALYIWLGQ